MDLCCICQQIIENDRGNIQADGLKTLTDMSNKLGDGLATILLKQSLPISIHKTCRRTYSKLSIVTCNKRKREQSANKTDIPERRIRRSEVPHYDPYTDCLYCTKTIKIFRNCSKTNPENYDKKVRLEHRDGHRIATIEILHNALAKAQERNDDWGNDVQSRIIPFLHHGDNVSEEAKYHHECQVRFNTGKEGSAKAQKINKVGRPTGNVDLEKDQYFLKLIEYLDADDKSDGQYTCSELSKIMNSFLTDGQKGYSSKWVMKKLIGHYGSDIIVTSQAGKETIVTLLDASNRILRQHQKDTEISKNEIIDMAAVIINDDIRSFIFDCTNYPKFNEMSNKEMIPESLWRLLNGIIKRKAAVNQEKVDRKRTAIAHAMMAANRPRSYISPILLGISTYINTKFESRELVDILSNLAFADDYREVSRLHDSLMPVNDSEFQVFNSEFLNFVFDNADINVRTLTGLNTWHTMGGIVAHTPADQDQAGATELNLHRSANIRSATKFGKFSQIPVQHYIKKGSGVKQLMVGKLEPPKVESQILKLAKLYDTMWLMSFPLLLPLSVKCPNWSGFMQVAVTNEPFKISTVQILPFINLDPTKPDSIYSALLFAQKQVSSQYHEVIDENKYLAAVTFDQPLYAKADDIQTSNYQELDRLFLRLGGFHMLMSYLGGIGFIMEGSGIRELLSTIYASNSIEHMMKGHAYTRALRGHFLVSAAITKLMIEFSPGCLMGVSINRFQNIYTDLLQGSYSGDVLSRKEEAFQFYQILTDLVHNLASQSRTSKLWVNYFQQIETVRLFLYAERTGNWDLHLHCVAQMIPIFHASGHLAYARSARRYLDCMKSLPGIMPANQFRKLAQEGYFTIRRSHRYWSGNFTDQTIEQLLMRQLKVSGGLAHGRGLTDSTQAKFVHVFPKCVPICNALEEFCDIHSHSSEQHTDLRDTASERDYQHFTILFDWLKNHNPFSYSATDGLVCITNGIVAESSANADNSYSKGKDVADKITGKKYGEIKLKRTDKVTSISAASNSVIVRGRKVHVNSNLLLLRTTCIIKNREDMSEHLCYEFARQPASLFEKGLMRKCTKSVLAKLIIEGVVPVSEKLKSTHYVIDGGYLLHKVVWPKHGTYGDVCNEYIAYSKRHYGHKVTFIFDGYENLHSTKYCEQDRRANINTAPAIVFTSDTTLSGCTQKDFLHNRRNKSRFISLLISKFTDAGMTCIQSKGDADYLIVSTAIQLADSNNLPVVLVGTDTDLLVQLVAQTLPGNNLYMQFDHNKLYPINELQENLNPNLRSHLLLAHAITGCDTVSAIYNKGKKKIVSILSKSKLNFSYLDVFKRNDASSDEITSAGEKILLMLYGAKSNVNTLNRQRYILYCQQLVQRQLTSSDGFQLQALPPTSDAAKYHSFRTYLQVQQWLGNEQIKPTDWGWRLADGKLVPIEMDGDVAPSCVLRLLSCGCKTGCFKKCSCRNNGLLCSPLCSGCRGNNCSNCEVDPCDEQ